MQITDENKLELMTIFVDDMCSIINEELDSIDGLGPGRRSNFKKALAAMLIDKPQIIFSHIPKNIIPTLEDIGFDEQSADTILSLVSLPENSTTSWWNNYNFAKKLGDGRGWTVGIFGACSGTGDLVMILEELQHIDPSHKLCKYIHPMKKTIGDDMTGLENLGKDIMLLGDDDKWQQAVWHIYIKIYWAFAKDFADKTGQCEKRPGPRLTKNSIRGFILDTAINHGPGIMGITPILRKMKNKSETDEIKWFLDFCEARRLLLKAGYQNLDSSKTGDRCTLWATIVKSGNLDLKRPITCSRGYWGSKTIE